MMNREYRPLSIDGGKPFAVLWRAAEADDAVEVQSADDANQATVVFHDELQRLRGQQTRGQLLLICRDEEETRTLLSQPLE